MQIKTTMRYPPHTSQNGHHWDFPGGPVVKNLPYNAGHAGPIPGQGTKIPHAVGQLSPCATTTEPTHPGACMPQLEKRKPQLERSPHASTKIPCATTKTKHSQK